MPLLIEFFIRLTPGVVLICITYLLIPRKNTLLKIILLIFGFIMMRDTMTPLGLWDFGVSSHILWLRFIDDAFVLIVLALLSFVATILIFQINQPLSKNIHWFKTKNRIQSVLVGILSSFLIAVPFMIPYIFLPIETRGGLFPSNLILPLMIFTLFGNLLEEVLFRGFLQNYLTSEVGTKRSILLSGLLFAVGHTFLATSVTDLGIWVLIFTLYEGLVCAFLSEKYGLVSATLAHGLAIFFLAVGHF